jgi:hypothetical protein
MLGLIDTQAADRTMIGSGSGTSWMLARLQATNLIP